MLQVVLLAASFFLAPKIWSHLLECFKKATYNGGLPRIRSVSFAPMPLHVTRILQEAALFLFFLLITGVHATAAVPNSARAAAITSVTPHIDLAGNAEYLEDPTGKMTVDDVIAAADRFRPTKAGENINFTYSPSAFWLRFSVASETGVPAGWVMEIAYPSLDFVDWYYPSDGGYRRMKSGDRVPFVMRDLPHRNIVFPVHVEPGKTTTYYLRVASEGTLAVPGRLWPNDRFQRQSGHDYLVLGLYFGTMAALLLYNFMLYLALRDRVLLQYVGYVAGFILGIASMNGLGVEFLWPDSIWWANSSLVFGLGFSIFCAVLFARTFTNCAALSKRVDFILKLSLLLAAATVFASLALPYRFATLLLSITALIFPPAAYYAGWLAWRHKVPGARYFLIAWAMMLLTIATLAMRNFGWLPSTFLTNNGMQIGSLVEALLLSFSLADRYNRLAAERNAAQAEAIAAREASVNALRRSEQMLEQRVAERTRELEAANVSLKLREKQLADMAHHDILTGLANRALLADHLARALARARRGGDGAGFAILAIDLDGFKEINDRYGHAAGDELLVEVSNRLRGSVRASDLVARLGGDEFVVVLDAPSAAEDLRSIADNLIAAISAPVPISGFGPVTVGASIGIAALEADDTIASLMRRADRAMYAAKAGGRGRCEFA